jgi:copper oxidase (laccase) domain-containing protein
MQQVHGADVLTVEGPGLAGPADALVTTTPGLALLAKGADCGTLALAADEGVVGVAHAGWRGLVAGIVDAVAGAFSALGAPSPVALLGPCIGPCCYAFGAADLETVVGELGPEVRGSTSTGAPALDLRAAVAGSCARAGIDLVHVDPRCTACADEGRSLYSHRARGDLERHGVLAWLP